MKLLYIIPARGNSKGLPGKNIKELAGKPLIAHSILYAKTVAKLGDVICVSTDSSEIIEVAASFGAKPPFVRPAELATDTAGTYEVVLHALNYYRKTEGQEFDAVVLLQPTSPFRDIAHFRAMILLMQENPVANMIVSVKHSKDNPYFTLFEETVDGYLYKSKPGNYLRRQDCPEVYAYNGAIYIMRVSALEAKPIHQFEQVVKYVMGDEYSIDIDTQKDWILAEYVLQQNANLLEFDK